MVVVPAVSGSGNNQCRSAWSSTPCRMCCLARCRTQKRPASSPKLHVSGSISQVCDSGLPGLSEIPLSDQQRWMVPQENNLHFRGRFPAVGRPTAVLTASGQPSTFWISSRTRTAPPLLPEALASLNLVRIVGRSRSADCSYWKSSAVDVVVGLPEAVQDLEHHGGLSHLDVVSDTTCY